MPGAVPPAGAGRGSVYALLALGLVLKYRSTGVVDFAHGAVAMFGAYVFLGLRTTGELQLPWIVLPHEIALEPRQHGRAAGAADHAGLRRVARAS